MKLKFLMFTMLLAAMGPGRDAPAPDPTELAAPAPPATVSRTEPQRNPARLPPVGARPPSVELPAEPESGDQTPLPGQLQVVDAAEVAPADFIWQQRPIVVFSDTPDDPAFTEQIRMLTQGSTMLVQRDVVVVTDTDPAANGIWRQQLRPSGFSLVILDKDGQVKQRKPSPWTVREIGRAIDRFPLRRQELGRAELLP